MERVPRTCLFMYHQSTAPAPPPDLPLAVEPVSPEPVSSAGSPPVVNAVVRHHVVPTHTAQMVLFVQAMSTPAQVVQMWPVIILRNACIYVKPDLKSRGEPLTRRSVTWIVLPCLHFFFTFSLRRGAMS